MTSNIENSNFALVIVDMQDFFLDKFPKEKSETLIANQSKVITFCMSKKMPISVLEYENRGETTTTLKILIKDYPHTEVIIKDSNGGFTNTNLDEILRAQKSKKLILMGINASGCVQDTAIGALNRGYEIITSRDIIASSSKRDGNLATSAKWYSQKGKFFESANNLIDFIKSK